jgi:hypothetical protein
VAGNPKSWTGRYLADILERHRKRKGAVREKVSA